MAIDKLILFIVCLALYLPGRDTLFVAVPIIVVIIMTSLSSWLDNGVYRTLVLAVFTIACIYEPLLIFFLPLMCFDIFISRWQVIALIAILPPAIHFQELGVALVFQIILITLLAWFMKSRALHLEQARLQALEMRDSAREIALQLENKNKELLEKQDYEINLATLNERNRIAREIHDQVGHLLTRAILQLGALLIRTSGSEQRESLQSVKNTLGESMDAIRYSLHDLHESSIDLQNELHKIIREFNYCPVNLQYSLESAPESKVVYAFLAIVREALANIARHSGADKADVILREHPGLYQLKIEDNGRGSRSAAENQPFAENNGREDYGIGIQSMTERVRKLDGQINFATKGGWTIFITVPKPIITAEEKKHG